MAYAIVGSFGTVASGTNSVAPSFPQSTTAGNLLLGWVIGWGTSLSVSFSDGNWTLGRSNSSTTFYTAIWYRENCGAGESAPTITVSGGTQANAAFAEFSGGATSSALDKTGQQTTSASSPLIVSSLTADTAAGQLYATAFGWLLSKAGTGTTADTYNNGATASGNANNDSTSTANHYRFAYGITTGNSSGDSNSETQSSMNITLGRGALASFKLFTAAERETFANPTNFQDPAIF